MSPIFLTGDPEWGDYTVEVSVRPLSLADPRAWSSATTRTAITTFAVSGGNQARLALRLPLETGFRVPDLARAGAGRLPL